MQAIGHDGRAHCTPSGSLSVKITGSGTGKSSDSAKHSVSTPTRTHKVATRPTDHVTDMRKVEDLTIDCVEHFDNMLDGRADINGSTLGLQPVADNVLVVVRVDYVRNDSTTGNSSGLKMRSMVWHVKNKPRSELRLSDYEYEGVGRRIKQRSKAVVTKGTEPGVTYNIEDVDVDKKTWKGFGMSRKHAVWHMLTDNEKRLLEITYSFDDDG
ncbi:hypothetical protein ACSBR2_009179 [Camellia fascicularis]